MPPSPAAPTGSPVPPALGDDEPPPRTTRQKVALAAGVAVGVATFALWLYAFFVYDPGRKVDELADRRFPTAAERVCARAESRLAQLPPATAARTPEDRADTVDRADAILTGMLDELEPLVPRGQGRVTRGVQQWIDDWRTHVQDRANYARALRTDPGARFMETTKGTRQISRAIDGFAQVNEMPSCEVPTDVG